MFLITFRAYYILQTIAFFLFTSIALLNVRPATINTFHTVGVVRVESCDVYFSKLHT